MRSFVENRTGLLKGVSDAFYPIHSATLHKQACNVIDGDNIPRPDVPNLNRKFHLVAFPIAVTLVDKLATKSSDFSLTVMV